MKRVILSLVALIVMVGVGRVVRADSAVTINVYPSLAPNADGSPSWNGYVANAQDGLQNGLATVGNPDTDPTAYQVVSNIAANQDLVTSYASWNGVANPTGAFVGELGNRLHFGVVITSATPFDLADVSFDLSSNDTGNTLSYIDNLAGTDFGNGKRVGVYNGPDGTVTYDASNPGSDTDLINTLYYVGAGNAWWPGGSDPDPSNPLLGQQGAIDSTAAWVSANVTEISATYTLTLPDVGSYSGSASVLVTPVPLPAAAGIGFCMLGGFGALFAMRKQLGRKARIA
jgi:hypothetical protein